MSLRLLSYAFVMVFLSACSQTPSPPHLSSQAGSWQDIDGRLGGGKVGSPTIALASGGSPVVVWQQRVGLSMKVQVSDEVDGQWVSLPDPARDTTRDATMPSVALRSDNQPVVAYVEMNQGYHNLYLRRWNGTAWVNQGNSLNQRKGYQVSYPFVALDKTGTPPTNYPTVAWAEWNGTDSDARVIRRTATGWQRLGILDLDPDDSAWFGLGSSALQLGKNGQPVVAWVNRSSQSGSDVTGLYVKKWNGATWESYTLDQFPLNDTSKSLKSYAFALDKNDRPVIAWVEDKFINQSPSLYHISSLRIKRWNGTQWVSVLNENYTYSWPAFWADSLSLAIDSLNQPVVAYTRWNGAKNLIRAKVRDRTTGTWISYGEVLNSNPPIYSAGERPSLVMQGGTTPIVSFTEGSGDYIAIKKWIP